MRYVKMYASRQCWFYCMLLLYMQISIQIAYADKNLGKTTGVIVLESSA